MFLKKKKEYIFSEKYKLTYKEFYSFEDKWGKRC